MRITFSALVCSMILTLSSQAAEGHRMLIGGSTGGAILEVSRDKKLVFSTGDAVKNRASSLFLVQNE